MLITHGHFPKVFREILLLEVLKGALDSRLVWFQKWKMLHSLSLETWLFSLDYWGLQYVFQLINFFTICFSSFRGVCVAVCVHVLCACCNCTPCDTSCTAGCYCEGGNEIRMCLSPLLFTLLGKVWDTEVRPKSKREKKKCQEKENERQNDSLQV